MRSKANIALFVVSVAALLITQIIPHHHHEEAVCFAVEHCEDDKACNENHSDHENEDSCGQTCVSNNTFLAAKFAPSSDLVSVHFFPILFFVVSNVLPVGVPDNGADESFCNNTGRYKSVELNEPNGLRAPPYLFV